MDWKKAIGDRIRKPRERLKWTREDLSAKTGGTLSPSRIGNYEQGLRLLKPQDAVILGRVLAVSPAHLMCLSEEMEMNTQESQLLASWRALPENERMAYLRRITAMSLVYKDAVPDEQLNHLAAPDSPIRKKPAKRKPATSKR